MAEHVGVSERTAQMWVAQYRVTGLRVLTAPRRHAGGRRSPPERGPVGAAPRPSPRVHHTDRRPTLSGSYGSFGIRYQPRSRRYAVHRHRIRLKVPRHATPRVTPTRIPLGKRGGARRPPEGCQPSDGTPKACSGSFRPCDGRHDPFPDGTVARPGRRLAALAGEVPDELPGAPDALRLPDTLGSPTVEVLPERPRFAVLAVNPVRGAVRSQWGGANLKGPTLAPALTEWFGAEPQAVVVWDGALGHRNHVVQATGVRTVLLPYSPELDPAECVFRAIRPEVEGLVYANLAAKQAVVDDWLRTFATDSARVRAIGLAPNFDMMWGYAASSDALSLRERTRDRAGVGMVATRCSKRLSCFFPAKRSAAVVPSRRVST